MDTNHSKQAPYRHQIANVQLAIRALVVRSLESLCAKLLRTSWKSERESPHWTDLEVVARRLLEVRGQTCTKSLRERYPLMGRPQMRLSLIIILGALITQPGNMSPSDYCWVLMGSDQDYRSQHWGHTNVARNLPRTEAKLTAPPKTDSKAYPSSKLVLRMSEAVRFPEVRRAPGRRSWSSAEQSPCRFPSARHLARPNKRKPARCPKEL